MYDEPLTHTPETDAMTTIQQAGEGITTSADIHGRITVTLPRRAPNDSRAVLSLAYDAGYVPVDVWCLARDLDDSTIRIGLERADKHPAGDRPVYKAANDLERETLEGAIYAYQNPAGTLSVQAPLRNVETDLVSVARDANLHLTSIVATDETMELRFE